MSFVKCKNPLRMYEHYILESKSILGRFFDKLGYCGICAKLAFTDNSFPTNPDISKQTFKQAGPDTL